MLVELGEVASSTRYNLFGPALYCLDASDSFAEDVKVRWQGDSWRGWPAWSGCCLPELACQSWVRAGIRERPGSAPPWAAPHRQRDERARSTRRVVGCGRAGQQGL